MNLRSAFPNWKTNGGMFYALEQNAGTPWKGQVDALSLDLDYFGNRSGGKVISDLVKAFIDETTHHVESTSITALASLLLAKYGLSWSRMWEAVNVDYEPLDNYSMTEITQAANTTSGQAQSTGSVWGFNSSSDQSADKTSSSSSVGETESRNLTRRGNIGVTTSAQMLTGELEVRRRSFFEEVYRNIDEVLVIDIFEDCEFDFYEGGSSSYVLPVATPTTLGGVKPVAKTSGMTQDVGIDSAGKLYTAPGGGYTLPPATASILGGVKIGAGVTVAADGTISVSASGAVTSVNGQTGDVTITAAGLGAEVSTNKVTSLSASSTDTEYPSAKCIYDLIGNVESALDEIIALQGGV